MRDFTGGAGYAVKNLSEGRLITRVSFSFTLYRRGSKFFFRGGELALQHVVVVVFSIQLHPRSLVLAFRFRCVHKTFIMRKPFLFPGRLVLFKLRSR
jgi:hypothetical protein